MNKTLAIASAVVRDAVRRKVVWIVVIFAALLSFVAPSLPSYGVGVASAVFREVCIALMFVAALVLALTLGATRVPAETERRTVFNILTRDVRRWQYLAGTWAGISGVIGAVVAAFTAVALVVGLVVYHAAMPVLLEAAVAVWFEMGVITAAAVALSSRFGAVTSSVGALAFVFIGHSMESLLNTGFAHVPWYVPSLSVFDVTNPVAHGAGISLVYGVGMAVAFVAWVALLLMAATALFGRRDL